MYGYQRKILKAQNDVVKSWDKESLRQRNLARLWRLMYYSLFLVSAEFPDINGKDKSNCFLETKMIFFKKFEVETFSKKNRGRILLISNLVVSVLRKKLKRIQDNPSLDILDIYQTEEVLSHKASTELAASYRAKKKQPIEYHPDDYPHEPEVWEESSIWTQLPDDCERTVFDECSLLRQMSFQKPLDCSFLFGEAESYGTEEVFFEEAGKSFFTHEEGIMMILEAAVSLGHTSDGKWLKQEDIQIYQLTKIGMNASQIKEEISCGRNFPRKSRKRLRSLFEDLNKEPLIRQLVRDRIVSIMKRKWKRELINS